MGERRKKVECCLHKVGGSGRGVVYMIDKQGTQNGALGQNTIGRGHDLHEDLHGRESMITSDTEGVR